jgi:general secretion pathway protein K
MSPGTKSQDVARRWRNRRYRMSERGVALIMVLGAIAVMTVMLTDAEDESSTEYAAATADRDSVQAEYLARSAVNLARLLVATEPTIRSAITPLFMMLGRQAPQLPVWEFSDRILSAFNDAESAQAFAATTGTDMSLAKNVGLTNGRWELQIVDEDRMINVNLGAANTVAHVRLAQELAGLLAPPQNNLLFEQRDKDGNVNDRLTICRSIIDWADPDEQLFSCDISGAAPPTGVEDINYYQSRPRPYKQKNCAFDSLEELRMVRGVDENFWSTFIEPDPTNPAKRNVTVWGQGAVNVNTANSQTLLGLICAGSPQAEVCIDPVQMQTFLMGVTMARGLTMGAPLFGSAKDFIQVMKGQGMIGPLLTTFGMKPIKFTSEQEFAKTISTESKVFSIYAVGIVKGYKREVRTKIHAVVDFRDAPPPGMAPVDPAMAAALGIPGGAGAAGAAGIPGAAGGSAAGIAGGAGTAGMGGVSADAIGGALRPSSGGTIIHYRIQ